MLQKVCAFLRIFIIMPPNVLLAYINTIPHFAFSLSTFSFLIFSLEVKRKVIDRRLREMMFDVSGILLVLKIKMQGAFRSMF